MTKIQSNALKIWLEKSNKDICLLERNLKSGETHMSYFFSQQIFEKLFKILIGIKHGDFDKTHDLNELYKQIKNIYGNEISFLKGYSIILNKLISMFYDERYGFDIIKYDLSELEEILKLAKKTYSFTKKNLKVKGSSL